MIIDSHCHLESENPPEKMIKTMDADGVDKVVLFAATCETLPKIPKGLLWFGRMLLQTPLAPIAVKIYEDAVTSKPGKIKISGDFKKIYMEPDNKPVLDVISKYPDRFIGFVFINPTGSYNVMEEFETCIANPLIKGVKVHTWFHNYSPAENLHKIAEICSEKGLPMLMHQGSRKDTADIMPLLSSFPKLKLILAHLGIPWFKRSFDLAKTNPNVYLDISGPYLSASIIQKAVKKVGASKLIYGTDAPYGLRTSVKGELSYKESLSWVTDLNIPKSEKEMILAKNLLSLLP